MFMPSSRRKRDGDTRTAPCTHGSRQASCAVRQERPSTQARQRRHRRRREWAPCSRSRWSKRFGCRVSDSGLRFGGRGQKGLGLRPEGAGSRHGHVLARPKFRAQRCSGDLPPFSPSALLPFCPSAPLPFSPKPRTRTICGLEKHSSRTCNLHPSTTSAPPPEPSRGAGRVSRRAKPLTRRVRAQYTGWPTRAKGPTEPTR